MAIVSVLLASSNPHKIQEVQAIWRRMQDTAAGERASAVELMGMDDWRSSVEEPVEDGLSFEDNALLKARHYAAATGMICLADDSGLEVDALDGQPGVRSARYADVTGPREDVDAANNALLLERLREVPRECRGARFVCTMALCAPPTPSHDVSGLPLVVRGTVEGRIIGPGADDPPRGDHGFGYDPLFFFPPLGKTTAQLTPSQKNAISHRGQAASLMWNEIKAWLASKNSTSSPV